MIRIGVVGTGYLGRLHTRIASEIPEVQLAGIVEMDDAVAREVAESFHVRRFENVAALAKEVDCAVVATPTTTHFEVARALLEAGRDVLVEKPIADEESAGRELVAIARRADRVLQVGHVERYNPAITAVAPLLRQIRYIEAERLGVFVG
ncbi:MAG TPA: Gfo/Idh/MocA family oxidoreductase, partial [Thermoanaerobaculia bacterium]|nr:Gfo/Idh/MocA family oxidoreductase [Thermoanaerobaculia bacterium]